LGVKIKKILLYLLFLLILISYASADLIINEIMYNPEGNDNNKEFIEVYSNEPINLSGFIIADSKSNDTLTLLQYYDSDYALITEEGFNLSGVEISVYSAGAAIGNNLNTEDSIFLYNKNRTLIDNISYTDICQGGHSLEFFNGSFYCSFYIGGTPGRLNSDRNKDYSGIILNEFFPNPEGDDNAPMPGGEFIELYNSGDNDTDLAGLYFKDFANHKIYLTDTTTIAGTIIQSKDYLVVYMNGFSGFLNNVDFEEIRLYDPYNNLINKVTYADPKEALSVSLVDNLWQNRLPTPNNENPEKEPEGESHFDIEGIEDLGEDNETKFGDTIKVRFNVYKGNTTKNSIKLYIENDEDKISKTTKANLGNKYTNYGLTLPIPIKSNCDEKYPDGDYYAKIGWTSLSGVEDSFKIKVKGINMKNCDKIYVERKPRAGTLDYDLIELPGTIEPNKEFTAKIELTNNDDEDHMVDIYSYVYRGSKCYSPGRETNKKKVLVRSGQTKEFELENIVPEAEPGHYNLKIKIKRDDQKTKKEITQEIEIIEEQIKEEQKDIKQISEMGDALGQKENIPLVLESIKQPLTIYESPGLRSKQLIAPLLIFLLLIYSAVLTWKR